MSAPPQRSGAAGHDDTKGGAAYLSFRVLSIQRTAYEKAHDGSYERPPLSRKSETNDATHDGTNQGEHEDTWEYTDTIHRYIYLISDQIPIMPRLFHVTTRLKAENILKEGLEPGRTTSESEFAILMAEKELGISRDDDDFWDRAGWDDSGSSSEQQAREMMSDILGETRPKGMPDHDRSLFFWTVEDQALGHRSAMDRKDQFFRYVVLEVDSEKVPCECFEAESDLVELLFDDLQNHSGEFASPADEEDEDRFYEEAEAYYKSMNRWDGKKDEGLEVLCPCDVPKEAIVSVDGKKVKDLGKEW